MKFINQENFKPVVEKAESGDAESRQIVVETLRPIKGDSVELIAEKIWYFIHLMYFTSLKFKDANFHLEIDLKFAEQIHSLINRGVPLYKVMLFIGYRESAKTARVKMNQSYMNLYLGDQVDYANVMSADGSGSVQFTMDMFNIFAFSKISKYFPNVISQDFARGKKESQTMSKFTTTTGITYSAGSALKTKRGAAQTSIQDDGEIDMLRPAQLILDDIENENTVKSYVITDSIRKVINAAIDGLDQVTGFCVCTANYLSLRGNIDYLIKKYRDREDACVVMIPIHDGFGEPMWPAKHCKTDAERAALAAEGIVKVSIESIKKDSDNFETEFLNNPSRSRVYFDDNVIKHIDDSNLVEESERDRNFRNSDGEEIQLPEQQGLLIIEKPTGHDMYEMSADTAGGNGGHQSAFTIWKVTGAKFVEVANFRSNQLKPEIFAAYSVNWARFYNNARINPERNFPGNEYIAFAKSLYKNFYYEDKDQDLIGVNTNLKTKPEMFVKFKKYLLQDIVEIRSRAMYLQISEYPANDVETIKQDESGGHFDLLMSGVIGIYKVQVEYKSDESEDDMDRAVGNVVDSLFSESQQTR
jgi:hypothetical protein